MLFYGFSKPVEWTKTSYFSADMTNLLNVEHVNNNKSRKNINGRL